MRENQNAVYDRNKYVNFIFYLHMIFYPPSAFGCAPHRQQLAGEPRPPAPPTTFRKTNCLFANRNLFVFNIAIALAPFAFPFLIPLRIGRTVIEVETESSSTKSHSTTPHISIAALLRTLLRSSSCTEAFCFCSSGDAKVVSRQRSRFSWSIESFAPR